MRPEPFRALVERELDRLPEAFRPAVAEVQIVIEERATAELLSSVGMEPEDDGLLGLYVGDPLTTRESAFAPVGAFPGSQRIYLFRKAILEHADHDPDVVAEEVRITLLHEIGHHFGLDEDRIDDLGYG